MGAILGGGWLGWQLLRQNGRLLLRLDELEQRLNEIEFGEAEQPKGLSIGTEAPVIELPDLAGKSRSPAEFLGQPLLLVFFNPDCGYCREMAPKLADLQRPEDSDQKSGGGTRPRVVLITAGDAEKNRQFFAGHKIIWPVLLQKANEVAEAYQANGTPTGYLVRAEGKIASALTIAAEALLALNQDKPESGKQKTEMNSDPAAATAADGDGRASRFSNCPLARSKLKRDGLKAGTPAPDFRLPKLDGRGDLALTEFRGKRVLLVFSSPNCGPCNELAPHLERFHRWQRATKQPLPTNLLLVAADVRRRTLLKTNVIRLLTSAATARAFKARDLVGRNLTLTLSPSEGE